MKILLHILYLSIICCISLILLGQDNERLKKASLYGKYSNLKTTITCKTMGSPLKEFNHFSYKDYGFYKGGTWCEKSDAPKGYYVFHDNTWFVWGTLNKKYNRKKTASINGKYYKLLKKIKRPQDKKFYKNFVEYGFKPYGLRTNWTPDAFYVYLYPDWYVWEKIRKPKNIPKDAYQNIKYTYAYSDLLFYVYSPSDKKQYGSNYEYGYYDNISSTYRGIFAMKGYWVYAYPYWYIWKNRKKVTDYRDIDKNADWPPTK